MNSIDDGFAPSDLIGHVNSLTVTLDCERYEMYSFLYTLVWLVYTSHRHTYTIGHLYLRVISKEHVELGFDIYISTSCVTFVIFVFRKNTIYS